jgi:iodotyrosine deiodinase
VVVSNKTLKSEICKIVEKEEKINYAKRMGERLLQEIAVLRTTWSKPYITSAPYLILVFKEVYGVTDDGKRKVHYYYETSVGMSCGLLVAAIQVDVLHNLYVP